MHQPTLSHALLVREGHLEAAHDLPAAIEPKVSSFGMIVEKKTTKQHHAGLPYILLYVRYYVQNNYSNYNFICERIAKLGWGGSRE